MQTQESIIELRDIAQKALVFQQSRKWSDAEIVKQFSGLGSTKTYKRILDLEDDLNELNIEAQLIKYRGAESQINKLIAEERGEEIEYTDFQNIEMALGAVSSAACEKSSNDRFVCIEGENGTGKDAILNAIVNQYTRKVVVSVEATELWREGNHSTPGDILAAFGVKNIPHMPALRWEAVHAEFARNHKILVVNEAHHMGWRQLNNFKSIINKTQNTTWAVVVFLCVPALIGRLKSKNYEEAKQLFGNRLKAAIRLQPPTTKEATLLMARRGVTFKTDADAARAAAALVVEAPEYGNWRHICRVIREARNAGPLTFEAFHGIQTGVIEGVDVTRRALRIREKKVSTKSLEATAA